MKRIFFSISLLVLSYSLWGQMDLRLLYIEEYKAIAINEMHRTGIPASIKLAQAILESNAGQSTLAQKANNHFGIKCGSIWNGRTYFRKDDDLNVRGKLVKSCFRSFRDAMDSFVEHSDFLAVQNRKRYGFLFNYDTSDYTNWAYGLKKAGYATDPSYAGSLIKIIEEYQLYAYDKPGGMPAFVVSESPSFDNDNTMSKVNDSETDNEVLDEISIDDFKTKITIKQHNSTSVTYSLSGDNVYKISDRAGIPVKKIIKFNDGIQEASANLAGGTRIYLATKKSKNKGKKKFHFVTDQDNMVSISQDYGIKLSSLYKMNNMPPGSEPAVGEKLRLRGKMSKGKKIKTRMLRVEDPSDENLEEPVTIRVLEMGNISDQQELAHESNFDMDMADTFIDEEQEEKRLSETNLDEITNEEEKLDVYPVEKYYLVSKGDTLWNISQRMSTSVQRIKELNNLRSNEIFIGDKLRIE